MKDTVFTVIKAAEKLRKSARYAEALTLFRKALAMSVKGGDLDGILDATMAIADISRMIGDFDKAVENYSEALEASEALGNGVTAADCMVGMGLSLRAMGMWKDAERFIAAAQKTYRKEGDKKGIAFSVWAEAGVLRVAGDIGKAIKKFKDGMDHFTTLQFAPGIAYSLCGLGGAHRIAGKYEESMTYYVQANGLFSELKDSFGKAYSHCGIGNAFRMMNRYGDAMKHFRKAETLYKKIGDRVSYSYTLWSIANVFKMKGDFAAARLHIGTAVKNFKATKDPRGLIYCSMTLGELEFMEGRKKAAEKRILAARESAAQHEFKLERSHASSLLAIVRGENGESRLLKSEYKKIGVEAHFSAIPVAMP